ncbi:hypothetical protein EDC96DRAFT_608590 [Choanephora cucurbitarum]|nr:hypothetical protein EDC96DRAFT_608590 [Choanephora cucurbitarum]
MASSAIHHKGAFQTPNNYKTNKKSWVDAVTAGRKRTSITTCGSSNTQPSVETGHLSVSAVNDVYKRVARPFLKGTFPNSLLIDITDVTNKQDFISELREVCMGSEHLWAISPTLRREYSRWNAEIAVSPSYFVRFQKDGFELKTQGKFSAFPSLSPSAEILKVSLSGLPMQYGRGKGGLAQLRLDMISNLKVFGNIFDFGLDFSAAGVYTGNGYVVIECFEKNTATSSPSLSHLVDWSYQPIDFNNTDSVTLLEKFDRVQVRATWASMAPYCRYCHGSDHALADCHISRVCPRKNNGAGEEAISLFHSYIHNTHPTSPLATRHLQRIQERQASPDFSLPDSLLDSQSNAVCRHCGLEGHSRTNSRYCLKNPKLLAEAVLTPEPSSLETVDSDVVMEDDLPLTLFHIPYNLTVGT